MSKSVGPRNNKESKLRSPPHPRFKSALDIRLFRYIDELPMTDNHGNTEVVVRAKQFNDESAVDVAWLSDPDAKFVFWLSQTGRHSVVFHDGRWFALMAVKNNRKTISQPGREDSYQVPSKRLGVQEVNFEPEVIEWMQNEIARFLAPSLVSD